jgi:hypothetical protein
LLLPLFLMNEQSVAMILPRCWQNGNFDDLCVPFMKLCERGKLSSIGAFCWFRCIDSDSWSLPSRTSLWWLKQDW